MIFALFLSAIFVAIIQAKPECPAMKYSAKLTVNSLTDPILLKKGSKINADFTVDINNDFMSVDELTVKVELQRKVLFFWIPIPCISGKIGSCTYKVNCQKINKIQKDRFGVVKYSCPFQQSQINDKVSVTVPDIGGGIVSTLASGKFRGRVIVENKNGGLLACYARENINVKSS